MTRARDVADAGHSTIATTADTISQKTSINLSGTYSTHQLLVADAYTFTGDTTVNDNLILGKLSDDGTDTVLEGSHTLQGTGQLEAGYVTSSGIGSVDGMTGTLGSGITIPAVGITGILPVGVTGGSGLDSVPAPAATAGSVIQTATRTYSGNSDSHNSKPMIKALDGGVAEYYCTIHNVLANSKVLVNFHVPSVFAASTAVETGNCIGIFRGGTAIYTPVMYSNYDRQDNVSGGHEMANQVQVVFLDESPGGEGFGGKDITYYLGVRSAETAYTTTLYCYEGGFHAVLMEIAG